MSEEKVLFEMRITEHGWQIYESPEWQASHRPRGLLTGLFRRIHRARAENLRQSLDSLQNIYDDLYGHPARSESQ